MDDVDPLSVDSTQTETELSGTISEEATQVEESATMDTLVPASGASTQLELPRDMLEATHVEETFEMNEVDTEGVPIEWPASPPPMAETLTASA